MLAHTMLPRLQTRGHREGAVLERLSLPALPVHLIHPSLSVTATVLAWALSGAALTALGGLTAARAKGRRTQLAVGMVLTLLGVAVLGSAVLYHNSLGQGVEPSAL
jgi:hypothetical protein